MMDISEVNRLDGLVDDFGDIAEHAPWVATLAEAARPFESRDAMIAAFQQAIMSASHDRQLELVRAHPDLAGKARLTKDSKAEQKGAGLDSLSEAEMARFNRLNTAYKERFGFPFIFAVKGADKFAILNNFENRIDNAHHDEFAMALEMVCRIVAFRLQDKVAQ